MCRLCEATPEGKALRARLDEIDARIKVRNPAANVGVASFMTKYGAQKVDVHGEPTGEPLISDEGRALLAERESAREAYRAHHDQFVIEAMRNATGPALIHLDPRDEEE